MMCDRVKELENMVQTVEQEAKERISNEK